MTRLQGRKLQLGHGVAARAPRRGETAPGAPSQAQRPPVRRPVVGASRAPLFRPSRPATPSHDVVVSSALERIVAAAPDDGAPDVQIASGTVASHADQLIVSVRFTNVSAFVVDHVRITSPIPSDVKYVPGSASGPGSEVLFSVDNGRTFARPAELTLPAHNGGARLADAADYTHVRWVLERGARCRRNRCGAVSRGAALNLDDMFGVDGALAERLPGFTYRAAQQQMAELVVEALESGRHAVIEAGTGIGKTFAYLLPVLLLGRRAIISTGTHTLQDQLFGRDLPLLGAVVGRPMEVAAAERPQQLLVLAAARRGAARRHSRRHDRRRHSSALDAWGQTSDKRRSHGARGSCR